MSMFVRLDTTALDNLPPKEAYQAATQIHHHAKALGAAYADQLAATLAAQHGQHQAADLLGIHQSTLAKRVTRHKENTMWAIPTDLPTTPTTGSTWWVKTVDPEPAQAAWVYIMRDSEEWLTYRCAASWYRSDEDEIAAGVHAATTIARALVSEVPTLVKVGKATEHGDGLIDVDKRDRAAAEVWERVRPALDTYPTSATKSDIVEWAHDVMGGNPGNGPHKIL